MKRIATGVFFTCLISMLLYTQESDVYPASFVKRNLEWHEMHNLTATETGIDFTYGNDPYKRGIDDYFESMNRLIGLLCPFHDDEGFYVSYTSSETGINIYEARFYPFVKTKEYDNIVKKIYYIFCHIVPGNNYLSVEDFNEFQKQLSTIIYSDPYENRIPDKIFVRKYGKDVVLKRGDISIYENAPRRRIEKIVSAMREYLYIVDSWNYCLKGQDFPDVYQYKIEEMFRYRYLEFGWAKTDYEFIRRISGWHRKHKLIQSETGILPYNSRDYYLELVKRSKELITSIELLLRWHKENEYILNYTSTEDDDSFEKWFIYPFVESKEFNELKMKICYIYCNFLPGDYSLTEENFIEIHDLISALKYTDPLINIPKTIVVQNDKKKDVELELMIDPFRDSLSIFIDDLANKLRMYLYLSDFLNYYLNGSDSDFFCLTEKGEYLNKDIK